MGKRRRWPSALGLAAALTCGSAIAQTPGEVDGVAFDDPESLGWAAEPQAADYNLYRGALDGLRVEDPPRCRAWQLTATSYATLDVPGPGEGFVYVVTASGPPGHCG